MISFDNLRLKFVTQIAGRNNSSTVPKLNSMFTMMFAFSEKIPSNNKNDVTSVITKLTLFAALKSAMVRTFETVMILAVSAKAYIPMPYIITTGMRATATDGNKNQNDPTPKVKSAGRIKTRSVASLCMSSESDQANKPTERTEITLIPRRRFMALCEAVTKKITANITAVVTNFLRLLIYVTDALTYAFTNTLSTSSSSSRASTKFESFSMSFSESSTKVTGFLMSRAS